MQLVVGLGNPGEQYAHTRHNVGFMVVETLAQRHGLSWQPMKKVGAQIARGRLSEGGAQGAGEQALLLKPQTYMNKSGQAVRGALEYFGQRDWRTSLETVFVVFDDLDLELGNWKAQFGKGPKVHNGLLSVYDHLGTDQFWHVRVGVDCRGGDRSIPGHEYVLQPFAPTEAEQVGTVVQAVVEHLSQSLVR